MILVKPSVEILAISLNPLELIEKAGRTCYKSEDKITEDSKIKFTEMILKRGHESVIEHAVATAKFICDRGVTHEIVRHRLASYSQESTRYCDYNNGHITFVIPNWIDCKAGFWNYNSEYNEGVEKPDWIDSTEHNWIRAMLASETSYKRLREAGWKPEQARSVLPNSLKTEIVMTANLREWRHFFKLRTSNAAHPQMREVAIPLLNMFKKQVPIIFDNIN